MFDHTAIDSPKKHFFFLSLSLFCCYLTPHGIIFHSQCNFAQIRCANKKKLLFFFVYEHFGYVNNLRLLVRVKSATNDNEMEKEYFSRDGCGWHYNYVVEWSVVVNDWKGMCLFE